MNKRLSFLLAIALLLCTLCSCVAPQTENPYTDTAANATVITTTTTATTTTTTTTTVATTTTTTTTTTAKPTTTTIKPTTTTAKPTTTTAAPADEPLSETVYVTKTGKKWHRSSSCNGGTYYESTLAEAERRGLTPCKKCAGG